MVEALAVVSIIANIIALIDFGAEIYERAHGFSDGIKDVPQVFRAVRDRLPLMKLALQNTEKRLSSAPVGQDDEKFCG